jgi:putative peptidoglycan lipid II flippase
LGLVGFSFVKVLAPAFFAREDTRTPVRIGIAALLVNLALGASSAWYLSRSGFNGPHVALAAATSVAAILNALLLYVGLRRADVIRHAPGWGMLLLRVVIANAAMITTLMQLQRAATWWLAAGLSQRVAWLALSVIAGAGVYFAVLLVLGLRTSQLRMRHD